VPVDAAGRVHPDVVAEVAPDGPFTLVAMAANNETGVLNDIPTLAEFTHARGGRLVCDATQQLGKLPVQLSDWGADYAAASAHKMYGPQGVGVLVVPSGAAVRPLVRGGGHQRGWRSGTLNVPGIAGFGVAARLAGERMVGGESDRLAGLRDRLLSLLTDRLGPLKVHGGDAPRLPNTLSVRIADVDADALIINCPDIAFSSGSACTSAVPTPSHVLTAMGLPEVHAEESVRLSLGRGNDVADIDQAAKAIGEAADRIRSLMGGG
jgi:cysteine desulfurase